MPGAVVVIGEALVDLLEDERPDGPVYVPAPGGSPMNVAVGLARLGVPCRLVSGIGDDPLGRWLRGFLEAEGVGLDAVTASERPTTIALTSFDGATPHFVFYGSPPSYADLATDGSIERALADARVVHAGSIGLLEPAVLDVVRAAFTRPGIVATIDPNVREALVDDLDAYRAMLDELFASAALVKLSVVDAAVLLPGLDEDAVLEAITATGARAVVLTLGARGLVALRRGRRTAVDALDITAVDETGAGDACMAGLVRALAVHGEDMTDDLWDEALATAVRISAHVCERPGAAASMPHLAEVIAASP